MKRVTAIITSLALAGSLAIPTTAQADENDLAKIIAGAVAIGIIAKAVDNKQKRKSSSSTTSAARAGQLGSLDGFGRTNDGRRIITGTIRDYDRSGPKPGRGYKKTPLPRSCLRIVETRRGDRLAYGERCVNRNFKHASKLPNSCETVVRTPRGLRTVFGAQCLRRDGWKVARR